VKGTTNIPGVCVLIKRGSEALFILRSNTGFKDGEYAVPSGHVENDESFTVAACREVFEEVGLKINPEKLSYLLTVQRRSINDTRIDVWFEATEWNGEPKNAEPERHSEITWLDINNLPANIIDYMNFGIQNIKKGYKYGEFGWG